MRLIEYCEYIRNPLAEAKARVVTVPPGESWTALRRFCQERGSVELRLSDFIREDEWLPMPDEIFGRVRDAMTEQTASGNALVLLGMPGYLALLTNEKKRAAIVALREWVDSASGQEAVCFLRSDDDTGSILKGVFANPRYRQGKQLVEIDSEQGVPPFEAGRMKVMLVGDDLASFIPEVCDTFQKYLRYTEDYTTDNSPRQIVVASKGRELAGLSAEVRQVVSLRDFARVFYDVVDANLTEDALSWMCARGKEGAGKTLSETLKRLFFPEGQVAERILRVFDKHTGAEREALLWLLKYAAPRRSYLACIISQKDVTVDNFRSAYVSGAAIRIEDAHIYSDERKKAISEAGVITSDAAIRQFIVRHKEQSTSQIASWLNCETSAERSELLRRCAADGIVSNVVKDAYPEAAAYLNMDRVFEDATLEEYFREYRELKMVDRLISEFSQKAQQADSPGSVQYRDAILQQYASDTGCALLVVDAMGAEWMPMLVALARQRNIGVDSIVVGKAHLPTSTKFNSIYWSDPTRRLPDIKRFDNIAHNGAEAHEARRAEENLAAALSVIGDEVLPRVADGLARFERVLVTADHGSSRLAVLAWQAKPRLARTLACEAGAEISDWRYRARGAQNECPPELEETLDGKHWVVRGYNRLPKQGGGQSFEVHGGATLEERLVPIVLFSKTGQFVPKSKSDGKPVQIVEKDDFDL